MSETCSFCGSGQFKKIKTTSQAQILDEYKRMFSLSFPLEILKSNFSFKKIYSLQCQSCLSIRYDPQPVGDAAFYEHIGRSLFWYYSGNRWEYPIALEILAKENTKSFLEVGCGAGHFLRLARKRGYEGHGSEMNPTSVAALRDEGFQIVTDLNHALVRYDAIFMFQLLEHILDPFSLLKSLLPYLQPGGVIVISTPVTPSCAAFNANPFLKPPHHQWLPTGKAFENLAQRLGVTREEMLFEPPDSEQIAYALRKWCGRFPYADKLGPYWSRAGRVALRVATLLGREWAKVGHTGLTVLRKNFPSH